MGEDNLNQHSLGEHSLGEHGLNQLGVTADAILLGADTLDDKIDSLTGHLSGLDDDRSRLVTLASHWWDVADKLDEHSRPLADQARRLSVTLAQLDEALIKMSEPVGVFVGVAGRTADAMRELATS